jgi:hypothetical protein
MAITPFYTLHITPWRCGILILSQNKKRLIDNMIWPLQLDAMSLACNPW